MPKRSSALTRFLLVMTLVLAGLTIVFFALSSYFFRDTYVSVHFSYLDRGVRSAAEMLDRYRTGSLSGKELQEAVNPALTTDGVFYTILDENRQTLAYTRNAASYFSGDALEGLLDAADRDEAALVRRREAGGTLLLAGQKVQGGYVLAGKPLRSFPGTLFSFRSRMMLSLSVLLAALLVVGIVCARRALRPARIITQMAGQITRGELVTLPENLPGEEMREIAGALNYMSRTVTRAISDLQYEKETISLVLEGLSEGILAADGSGRILHENAAAWRLLGGEESAAYGAVMAAMREKEKAPQWSRKFTAGDRVLYFAVSRLPLEEKSGTSRGTVALIRDVTEQERLERTRYDYVANISHELRTPLASIRGLAEGLRDGLAAQKTDRQRYYNIIVEEATRLSRLVNDLLELSSLQSNPAAFETERVDPNELIYDLHDRNGSLFTEKGVAFRPSLPDAPLPCIPSNEDRLSQVLTIFLDNARKYTPAGGSVVLGAEGAEGGVRFFVKDTGIGMDEETRRLAFERFHQAERGRSDKGSGLGLSIAKEILQKMGAEIRLQSAPGQGSEFSFVVGAEKT